jgi:hypothetical protein
VLFVLGRRMQSKKQILFELKLNCVLSAAACRGDALVNNALHGMSAKTNTHSQSWKWSLAKTVQQKTHK